MHRSGHRELLATDVPWKYWCLRHFWSFTLWLFVFVHTNCHTTLKPDELAGTSATQARNQEANLDSFYEHHNGIDRNALLTPKVLTKGKSKRCD